MKTKCLIVLPALVQWHNGPTVKSSVHCALQKKNQPCEAMTLSGEGHFNITMTLSVQNFIWRCLLKYQIAGIL